MKELKEVVKFAIELGEAVDKSLSDKKIDISDIPLFINAFMSAPEALTGINKVGSEWKAASFEQKQLLAKEIEQELDLKSDHVEKIIEESVRLLVDIESLIKLIKG